MELQDKTLKCVDCGADFIFSASEQEFYQSKGFVNEPKRCGECRSQHKANRNGGNSRGGNRQQELSTVNCSACGKETQVPFKPVQGKPVYCRDCYKANR